jgi:hypothetical protein
LADEAVASGGAAAEREFERFLDFATGELLATNNKERGA